MDVTPKKLVESSFRCFICSTATIAKDKIYIFEKISLDITQRIVNDRPAWIPLMVSGYDAF